MIDPKYLMMLQAGTDALMLFEEGQKKECKTLGDLITKTFCYTIVGNLVDNYGADSVFEAYNDYLRFNDGETQ